MRYSDFCFGLAGSDTGWTGVREWKLLPSSCFSAICVKWTFLGTLPLKALQANQGGRQTEYFLPQIWPLPGRAKMLHSQCFNTFLRNWWDTFSRADPNSLCWSWRNESQLVLLPSILVHFKCKHEWRDSPDSTHSYTHLPQEQVKLLLCAIALAVVSQTQPCHQFFHSRQQSVCFFNWPTSHHCCELVFLWIFRAN